jgi:hypothetical protein
MEDDYFFHIHSGTFQVYLCKKEKFNIDAPMIPIVGFLFDMKKETIGFVNFNDQDIADYDNVTYLPMELEISIRTLQLGNLKNAQKIYMYLQLLVGVGIET